MRISEKLHELMRLKNLSRYRLAKESGVPYTTLIKILDGTTKNPQIESLVALADYFGVSVDYLHGLSAKAIIEDRLQELNMTLEDLSTLTNIPLKKLQELDNLYPNPWDYEEGGIIDRIARALEMDFNKLAAAFARQEPPIPDNLPKSSIEEVFADVDFEPDNNYRKIERLARKLSPQDRKKALGILRAAFTEAFEDDDDADHI